ncbi:hypothetical protein GOQ27_16740 [Clostridium sp. D2Q-11]|uniref:YceG-like family protein n=1 Tax=Anaeromonas frigoriresistens TaxID=2683708 RepID=A0A942ZA94_9FIRM|nr:hypothetical protein [Anaeromonas frigoriresistens]MBS4540128.1 hypothetical protein [Anaeromonas frigoriresistens]
MKKFKTTDIAILLLGLGSGIILTASIFYYNPTIQYKEYTDEEIVAKYTEIKLRDERKNESLEDNNEDESKDKTEDMEEEAKEVKFIINKGETITEIIDRLYELNIIESKESFLDRLKVREATGKIQYGEFDIELPISYDELINKLISK